jgi:hypothetical protein
MVSMIQKQNSFIGGLLTEEAHERSDKPAYYHSLRRADNIVIDGHGWFRRRQGTSFIGEIAHRLNLITVGYAITALNGGDVSKLTNGDYFDYFKTTVTLETIDGSVAFHVTFGMTTPVVYFDVDMVSLDDADNGRALGTSDFETQYSSDGGTSWETSKNIYMTNGDDDSYWGAIHWKLGRMGARIWEPMSCGAVG